MTTNAKSAHGTTLTWNGQDIAELTEITPPKTKLSKIEVTNNDSGGWVERIAGLLDGGEFSIKGNFYEGDTDGQIALQSDHIAKTARTAVITLPAAFGTSLTMTAYCTEFGLVTPQNDGGEVSFEATFSITGQPAFAVATSTGLTTPFFAVDTGTIVPTPAGDVYTYVVDVATGEDSITVTPTASAGTITVNGNTVTSGEASSAIALGAAGSVTPVTIVVTETGKASKTYTLYVARAAL